MKLKVNTSYLNNLYFFVSNLTEFHFSCRDDYNREWLHSTGQLNKQEKEILKTLAIIFKSRGFESSKKPYLGKAFYIPPEKDKFNNLSISISEKEYQNIKNGFELFKDRFEHTYNPHLLKIWKLKLEKEFNRKRFKELLNTIEIFFEPKDKPDLLKIHLFSSPLKNSFSRGGANLGDRNITLEVPIHDQSAHQIEYASNTVIHEISHIWLEKRLKEILPAEKRKALTPLTKEIIVDALAPLGYPSSVFSDKIDPISEFLLPNLPTSFKTYQEKKETSYKRFSSSLIWATYPVMSYYISNKRKMDKEFIQEILNLLKQKRVNY